MGTCTQATLAWGFIIPRKKLYAFLQAFRAHEQGEVDKDSKDHIEGPPGKKVKTGPHEGTPAFGEDEERELIDYVQAAIVSKRLQGYIEFPTGESNNTFAFLYGKDDYDEDEEEKDTSYKVERWGGENYGATSITVGTALAPRKLSKIVEEKGEELREAIHLKDAGIEVEEQWILTVDIG